MSQTPKKRKELFAAIANLIVTLECSRDKPVAGCHQDSRTSGLPGMPCVMTVVVP